MTSGNYQRHFKVLGKLAYLYDIAGSATSSEATLLATNTDHISTSLPDDNPSVFLFSAFTNSIQSAINSGPTVLQNLAKQIAGLYVQQSLFTSGLTTVPSGNSPLAILTALATEMTSVDSKTLTTLASTGLVNFFDAVMGSAGSWNTAADGSADYKDSVYVVSAIV